jgi:hypothetical protein
MNKTAIMILNALNKNNRIYTKENFISLPEELPVLFDDEFSPCGKACNFKFNDNKLLCDINLDHHSILGTMSDVDINTTFAFSPCGEGMYNDENTITDYTITDYTMEEIRIIKEEESAFDF